MRALLLSAIATVLLAPSIGGAQQKPAPAAPKDDGTTVSGVTVEARRNLNLQKNYPSVVQKFVDSHEADGPHGGLTRWTTGLCPMVEGLSKPFNDFVHRRLLQVAIEVGAPKPGECEYVNVLVLFTTEPQKLLDDVRSHHPAYLGYHYPSDTKMLASFEPPLKVLHETGTRQWDGGFTRDSPDFAPTGETTGRLRTGLTSEFMFVLVVVDPSLVEGQPIGRVADNIAEQVLSNPGRRKGCAALPSILDSLDPACPASDTVEELTDYDMALLKGLYHSEPDSQASLQRGTIFREIMKRTRPPAPAASH